MTSRYNSNLHRTNNVRYTNRTVISGKTIHPPRKIMDHPDDRERARLVQIERIGNSLRQSAKNNDDGIDETLNDIDKLIARRISARASRIEDSWQRKVRGRDSAGNDQVRPQIWNEDQPPRKVPLFLQEHYVPIFGSTISRRIIREYDKGLDAAITNFLRKHEMPNGITLIGIREEQQQRRKVIISTPRADLSDDAKEAVRALEAEKKWRQRQRQKSKLTPGLG